MQKLYFNLLIILALFSGGWCAWVIYWHFPFEGPVRTCGINVQVLAKGNEKEDTLGHGADLDIVIGQNRMIVRGKYYHADKISNIDRVINFSEPLRHPQSKVTVSSVQKKSEDNVTVQENIGLDLTKGDKFDLFYQKTYGGRYFIYFDSFKLGECQVVFG